MTSLMLRMIAIGVALATACHSASAQTLPKIPEPEVEVLVEKATGRTLRGRIELLGTGTIDFKRQGIGYETERLQLDEYELRFADGLTNGPQLVALAEKRVQFHEQSIRRIESEGGDAAGQDRVRQEIDATKALLERIKLPIRRQQVRRWRTLEQAVERMDIKKALQTHRALQTTRKRPTLQALIGAALDNRLDSIAELERQFGDELNQQQSGNLPGDVASRLRAQVSTLAAGAKHLVDPGGELNEPDQLASQITALQQQLQGLAALGDLGLLGREFLESITRRESKVRSLHDRAVTTWKFCSPTSDVARNAKQIFDERTQLDLNDATAKFDPLRRKLQMIDRALSQQPASEPIRTARNFLARTQQRVIEMEFETRLGIVQSRIDGLMDQIDSAQSLQEAEQLALQLGSMSGQLDSLGQSARRLRRGERNVADLRNTVKSSVLIVSCKRERLGLESINNQLSELLQPADSQTLARRAEAAADAQRSLLAIAERVKELGSSRSDVLRTQRLARDTKLRVDAALLLLQIHQPLSRAVESDNWSSEELEQNRNVLDEAQTAHDALNDVRALRWESYNQLLTHTNSQMQTLRGQIESQAPRTQLSELQTAIEARMRETSSALELGELARGYKAFAAMKDEMDRLVSLASDKPQLASSRAYQQAIARNQKTQQTIHQRYRQALQKHRSGNGWIRLPIDQEVWVSPSPENRVLEIQLLMDQGRLEDAQSRLTAFRGEFADPEWQERADQLDLEVQFQRGVEREEAEDIEGAREHFASIADQQVNVGKPLGDAARSALTRLDHLLDQQDTQRNDVRRLWAIGLIVLAVLAVVGWFVWQSSETGRLHRGEAYIRRAQAAIAAGDFSKRDDFLRRAAILLADFPDTHPRASRLRDRLTQTDLPETSDRPQERAIDFSVPEVSETVQLIVSESTSIDDVPTCVDWLRQSNSDDPLRRDVIGWLRKRLRPSKSMSEEELQRITEMIRITRKHYPKDSTLWIYEFASLYWSQKFDQANQLADQVDASDWSPQSGQEEMALVLGICLMKKGKWKAAARILKPLREHATLRNDVTRWLKIGRIGAATADPGKRHAATKLVGGVLKG